MTRSKSDRSLRKRRRNELGMPALLNMTWSPPKWPTAKSTSSWTSSASATSVRLKTADSPSVAASSSPRSASTSAITTFAPSSTNSSAVARPIPLDPPVTIATLPVSSWSISRVSRSFCPPLTELRDSEGSSSRGRNRPPGPPGGTLQTLFSPGGHRSRCRSVPEPRPDGNVGPTRSVADHLSRSESVRMHCVGYDTLLHCKQCNQPAS